MSAIQRADAKLCEAAKRYGEMSNQVEGDEPDRRRAEIARMVRGFLRAI
jgi:hypothetical protein